MSEIEDAIQKGITDMCSNCGIEVEHETVEHDCKKYFASAVEAVLKQQAMPDIQKIRNIIADEITAEWLYEIGCEDMTPKQLSEAIQKKVRGE